VTAASAMPGEPNEDALNRALAAVSSDTAHPYRLEEHQCSISVPLPAGLIDDLSVLVVTVRLTRDIVSFISPLASLTQAELPSDLATALLRRQFFASHTEGASFALADREDVLVALYHWMPVDITADGFSAIFGRFVSAALRLRDEVVHMAGQGAPLHVLRSQD